MGILKKRGIVRGLTPERLYLILSDLGPTFIKLGQMLSMRSDLLPQAYCDELAKLRTITNPMDFDELKTILRQEYDQNPDDIFACIDAEPIGAASVAQVHRARLITGEDVVIKVQRQGIYETMAEDILLLKNAATLFKTVGISDEQLDWRMVLDEMWHVAKQEMNFALEATQMLEFQRHHRDVKYLAFPRVYTQYSNTKVLVMETIQGFNIDDTTALKAQGYDLEEIAQKLAHNYVKQILENGFFHADPHAGNIKIRDGKIIWIDLGMMGRLTLRDKELFAAMIRSVIDNDPGKLTEAVLAIGVVSGTIDHAELAHDLDSMIIQYVQQDFRTMDFLRLSEDLFRILRKHRIALPQGISMLARGLVTLQSILSMLSDAINFLSIASGYFAGDLLKNLDPQKELSLMLRTGYASLKKSLEIPDQLSTTLQSFNRGRTRVKIEFSFSDSTKNHLDTITRKLAFSVMSSMLFVGSAILCLTDTAPKIIGIPILAFLGYTSSLVLAGIFIRGLLKGS
ncbi:MAG: AarF/UbiB family protein [Peptococcaceae bacterium]|nr:AarF/UbiB family protein [Peptococcaceae bacterium]